MIRARAEHEAAAATYQALREQIRFDVQQRTLEAQQNLQAAEAAVAVSRAHLLILGYRGDEIDSMDPIAEGERVVTRGGYMVKLASTTAAIGHPHAH